MKKEITITISGKQGRGKSTLKTLFERVLDNLTEHEEAVLGDVVINKATDIMVPVEEYLCLKKDQVELNCLRAGGVNNWDWYGDSLSDNKYEEQIEALHDAMVDIIATKRWFFELIKKGIIVL